MNKSAEDVLFEKVDRNANDISDIEVKVGILEEKTDRNTIEIDRWSGRLWAIVIMITLGLISQMTAWVLFYSKGS